MAKKMTVSPTQQPVAWRWRMPDYGVDGWVFSANLPRRSLAIYEPLYLTPPIPNPPSRERLIEIMEENIKGHFIGTDDAADAILACISGGASS